MSEQMIQTIRDYFATQPVTKAWLFGSYARGEEKENSDVDLLVVFDEKKNVSLLTHIKIQYDLEDRLGKKVDLVTDGTLLPFVEESVNKDKKVIYERNS